MKRHGAAFIVIAAVAFLNLGLGSRADTARLPSRESCKTELGFIFDWCESRAHSPCSIVEEENMAACQAGCVMYLCPEQITCTELDPLWCGSPCEDRSGATFWRNMNIALDHCAHLQPDNDQNTRWESSDFLAWQGCISADNGRQCPAIRTVRERSQQEAHGGASQGGVDSVE